MHFNVIFFILSRIFTHILNQITIFKTNLVISFYVLDIQNKNYNSKHKQISKSIFAHVEITYL